MFVDGARLYRSTECEYDTPPDEGVRPCLQVVDISEPTRPRPLGSARLHEPSGYDGQVVGHHAIVTTAQRLLVFDVADPARPREVSSYRYKSLVGEQRTQLAVADGRAWVVGVQDVEVVDVSDPLHPTHLVSPRLFSGSGRPPAYSVVIGRAVYVGGDGLWVLDVEVR